jgi:hypothetical protein
VVVVEDLTEEGQEGDGGRVDALAEAHAEPACGAVDQLGRQVLGEGQAVVLP